MFSRSDLDELDIAIYRAEREIGCKMDIFRRAYDEIKTRLDEDDKTAETVKEILSRY